MCSLHAQSMPCSSSFVAVEMVHPKLDLLTHFVSTMSCTTRQICKRTYVIPAAASRAVQLLAAEAVLEDGGSSVARESVRAVVTGSTASQTARLAVECGKFLVACRGVTLLAACTGCARAQLHILRICSRCCWLALNIELQPVRGGAPNHGTAGSATTAYNRAACHETLHPPRKPADRQHTCCAGHGRAGGRQCNGCRGDE